MQKLTEEQWRDACSLADAAADLPPQARIGFLEASGAEAEILEQAKLLLTDLGPGEQAADRVGSSAGRFVITDYCGSGGVGDVYRAKDTELDRTVALKFLRPAALEYYGAIERFVREAKTVSSLNHANIVTVHEVLHSGAEQAIVMEFVEGTPLRTLCVAPQPLEKVAAIGRQIALALDAAHLRGIVHRDIKPENAILRPDGNIKVLDFGIAVSQSGQRDGESVLSASHLFAGTWRYMSPEQSRGEPVTTATDVFSLALVLCELLGGGSPGSDLPTLSYSKRALPAALPTPSLAQIPSRLRPLLHSMLAQSATDRPSAAVVAQRLSTIEHALLAKSRRSLAIAVLLAAVICSALLLSFWFQDNVPVTLLASAVSVEPGEKFSPTFSPNGDRLAYAWDRKGAPRQIYVQAIDERTGAASSPVRLTNSPLGEDLPAWSPDGKQIAFTRERGIAHWDIILYDTFTGSERHLTSFAGRSLSWTTDGRWLLAAEQTNVSRKIALISATNGNQYLLTSGSSMVNDEQPTSTPDSRIAIFARFFPSYQSRLATVPIRPSNTITDQPSFLSWPTFKPSSVRNPAYSENGRDLFFIAQTDNIRRLYRSHSGHTPILLASLGERIDAFAIPAHRNRLAFIRNLDDTDIWKLQLKPTGSVPAGRMTQVITSSRMEQRPAISPDGLRICFESNRSGYQELWLLDLRTGHISPLTTSRAVVGSPRWSPDSNWIVYSEQSGNSSSLYRISVSRRQPQRLTRAEEVDDILPIVSPDGQWVYFSSNRSRHYQIWRIPFAGGPPVLQTDNDGTDPELSRDGRYLYYLEKNWIPSRLWRKDLFSGNIVHIADNVFFGAYVVGRKTIYVTHLLGEDFKLFSLTLDGHHSHFLANMPFNTVAGFSMDTKEDTLYFAQLASSGHEIMLVNSF